MMPMTPKQKKVHEKLRNSLPVRQHLKEWPKQGSGPRRGDRDAKWGSG